jgi:hypothetical protein
MESGRGLKKDMKVKGGLRGDVEGEKGEGNKKG